MSSVKKSPINQRISPFLAKRVVCFSFRRRHMRKRIYPRGKIFGIVDIHFGKRDTFSQKAKCREDTYEFKYFIN